MVLWRKESGTAIHSLQSDLKLSLASYKHLLDEREPAVCHTLGWGLIEEEEDTALTPKLL